MKKNPHLSAAGFADLGIKSSFLKALERAEIFTPSDIQTEMIPEAIAGRDIIGQARTGTGKTIAFALPILQSIDCKGGIQALCLVPTRELALQVVDEIRKISHGTGVKVAAIYGGERIRTQMNKLEKQPQFIVGTPGRMLDFLGRGLLDMKALRAVVLDEVDRMLDIGFRDDIRRILSQFKAPHQTVVVSATIDDSIKRLIHKHTKDPVWLDVSRDQVSVEEIDQFYVTVDPHDKFRLLKVVLDEEKPDLAIVFTNTKHAARRLAKRLHDAGHKAAEIHGDLRQTKRQSVMKRFRDQDIHLLIATDLAAHGIDVDDITHIIQYDIPDDPEVHVHRVGRTGRMGKAGRAITFVTRDQGKQLTAVEMLINKLIPVLEFDGFKPRAREAVAS